MKTFRVAFHHEDSGYCKTTFKAVGEARYFNRIAGDGRYTVYPSQPFSKILLGYLHKERTQKPHALTARTSVRGEDGKKRLSPEHQRQKNIGNPARERTQNLIGV
jgi:hypothetical protein